MNRPTKNYFHKKYSFLLICLSLIDFLPLPVFRSKSLLPCRAVPSEPNRWHGALELFLLLHTCSPPVSHTDEAQQTTSVLPLRSAAAIMGSCPVWFRFIFCSGHARPSRRLKVPMSFVNSLHNSHSLRLNCFLRRAGRFRRCPNAVTHFLLSTELQLQLQTELLADGTTDVVTSQTAANVTTSGTIATAARNRRRLARWRRRRTSRSGGRRSCTAAARLHLSLAIFVDRELTFRGDGCHRFRSGEGRI